MKVKSSTWDTFIALMLFAGLFLNGEVIRLFGASGLPLLMAGYVAHAMHRAGDRRSYRYVGSAMLAASVALLPTGVRNDGIALAASTLIYSTLIWLAVQPNNSRAPEIRVRPMLRCTSTIIILNSVIGALFYGYSTYGTKLISSGGGLLSSGVKGIYYSGNELAVIVVIISLAWFKSPAVRGVDDLLRIGVLISGIAIMTKVAVISCGLLLVVLAAEKIRRFRTFGDLFILFAIVVALYYGVSAFGVRAYERFLFFSDKGDIALAALSGRLERWLEMLNDQTILTVFIGVNNIQHPLNLESDFLDMYANFGLIGLMILSLPILRLIMHSGDRVLTFTAVYVFCVSFLSGHVFYYAGPAFTLYLVHRAVR
ncbi:O-antigen ligase family protein [Sulfitobacter sp. W074]|uniref:O-antigen ligase family protein n=1 Tax=Sulfitobacter sp. W074 TaxID=2867026 RepID=UPI0021A8A96D|nr:O-antigen ligase family protein [Sulfitobacter sp. W074]UWR39649.1 O-antigen ligase family protein [Sulfitobacter sp. W074]